MSKMFVCLLLCWPLLGLAEASGPVAPLALGEVVDAALRAFPGLLAAEQRKPLAAGELQTAQGGFDTLLKSQNRSPRPRSSAMQNCARR